MTNSNQNPSPPSPAVVEETSVREVIRWAQAILTALNVGDIKNESPLHLKLREVMIGCRQSYLNEIRYCKCGHNQSRHYGEDSHCLSDFCTCKKFRSDEAASGRASPVAQGDNAGDNSSLLPPPLNEIPLAHSEHPSAETGLLPCPFCGDTHHTLTLFDLLDNDSVDPIQFVQCDNIFCGASGPPATHDITIDKWNRRLTQLPEPTDSPQASSVSQPETSVRKEKSYIIDTPDGEALIEPASWDETLATTESNTVQGQVAALSDEEIKILIAEACGWKPCIKNGKKDWSYCNGPHGGMGHVLPNYPADLNAMHEAEATLQGEKRDLYAFHLYGNRGPSYTTDLFEVAHKTARQRAEAFVLTLGLKP